MTLLAPWALWFAAVGAAIVGLYVLKIKRQRQLVPALDFWRQLAGRTKVHSLFDRLKRLLSLLLWLAIAACLILALGNPIFSLGRVKPQSIAVIVDNSASMQAREGERPEGTRLALAQSALQELCGRRPVNDSWLLIEAAREPRVLVPWTHDRKAVTAAAAALVPHNGRADLGAAVELASQLLDGKPDPLIVILSDGDHGAVEALAAKDERIVPWPIGTMRDNLGITTLSVRRHPQDANHHALIVVHNETDEAIDTQVTLSIDGRTYSVELVHVEPGGEWEKTVVVEAPEGGVLRASLDRPDALALDNDAYAILPPIRPAVVWLVSPQEDAFFFEQALAAMDPLIDAEHSLTLTLEQYEAARRALASRGAADTSSSDAAALEPPDLVVFNTTAPSALPPTGSFIVVNAVPGDVPAQVVGTLESPEVFLSPREHPLTQYLSFNGVRIHDARRIRLTDRATVLAHTTDGDPLIFLHERPNRQTLVLGFDVLESDLPFRNAFPLLLRNAVAFLYDEAPSWLRRDYGIGVPISPLKALPTDSGRATVTIDSGGGVGAGQTTTELDVKGGRFTFPGCRMPAAVRATVGDATAFTAVNLCDADETRLSPMESPKGSEDPATRLSLTGTLLGTMPWIAFAIVAALLVALEWMTYSFRWTE